MNIRSGSLKFIVFLFTGIGSGSVDSRNVFEPHSTNLESHKSCNLYISSRFCRPCMYKVKAELSEFNHIDTLFIVTEINNFFKRDHFLRLIGKELSGVAIEDTIYESYTGEYYLKNAHTNFSDSCLNALFLRSSPFIFTRSGCTEFSFYGT